MQRTIEIPAAWVPLIVRGLEFASSELHDGPTHPDEELEKASERDAQAFGAMSWAVLRRARHQLPACGHSACSQWYIDTGRNECVQ